MAYKERKRNMTRTQEIKTLVEQVFRHFHEHPELSYQEFETTACLRKELERAGITILDTGLKTGLVASIGDGAGPVIALRGDIDGLPIQEETDLPYKSQEAGRMHACGHDFHAAAVLGAALLLKEKEKVLGGTVKVIFQPAEEAPGGARTVLETGVMDDVQAVFGIHIIGNVPVGTYAIRSGAVTAAVDTFKITFRGKGSHGAHPDRGLDPVVAAANFVGAVQTIVSRNSDPFAANLVSVTHIQGGNTWNVIPETAFVEGTVRTMTKADRELVESHLRVMADHIAQAYGERADVEWIPGPPATWNDPAWSDFSARIAAEQGIRVVPAPSNLGGEDFAYFLEKIPGAYIQIGVGNTYSNHHPKFQLDPAALYPASEYLVRLAGAALDKLQKGQP